MAIGEPYVTLNEMKTYLGIDLAKVSQDTSITNAVDSASREIERFCNRQFNKDTVATARVFEPIDWRHAKVDDFWTTSGLIVETDPGGTGAFSNTWSSGDYELEPLNGIVDGQAGWPFNRLRSCGGFYMPIYRREPYRRKAVLRLTAQWGWATVPSPVKQACFILAAQTFKLADAPFGVAGMDQFGVVRVRDLPQVAAKLSRYVDEPVMVG